MRPTTGVITASIIATVTSTLLYVISRTSGFPFGPGPANAPRFTDPLHAEGHPNYAALTDAPSRSGCSTSAAWWRRSRSIVLLVSMLPQSAGGSPRTPSAPSARYCGRSGGPESSPDPTHCDADRAGGAGRRRLFALQPIRVHADSMQPTLHSGDELIIDRLSLALRAPHRGEIVVANSPEGGLVVKRVAAVGGDSVGIEDGVLVVNGKQQREKYVDYASIDGVYFGPVDVPRGDVFLLGDNRGNSEDSRDFGAVPEDDVVGPPPRPDLATEQIAVRRPR